MTEIPIINVDERGFDQNGEDFCYVPTPEAIAAGFVTSREVVLRYPDGRRVSARQTLVTEKGLAELKRGFSSGHATQH